MGDERVSVKGVLLHGGRVLLLSNRRGEWDLPGGQPDPGELSVRAGPLAESKRPAGSLRRAFRSFKRRG